MIAGLIYRSLDRGAIAFLVTLAAIGILVPVLNLAGAGDLAVSPVVLFRRPVRQVSLLRASWRWRST